MNLKLRQFARRVDRLPYLGYTARLVFTLATLPRILQLVRSHEHILRAAGTPQNMGSSSSLAASDVPVSAAWSQHAPAFLNAVSTVGAFGHELAKTQKAARDLADRVHAIEREQLKASVGVTDNAVSTMGALGHELANFHKVARGLAERIDAIDGELASVKASAGVAERASALVGELESRLSTKQEAKLAALWEVTSRHWESIGALWQRLEFIRAEVLFEQKYSSGTPKNPKRVINQHAMDQFRPGEFKLNLGCGHMPLPGFVNIDARELPRVDVVASVDDLPFEEGSVREIHSAHVLEHFPIEELRRRLLPYWRRLLAPGGVFRAIVPDAEAMVDAYAQRIYAFEDFREVFFGSQEYRGDFHFNMFTPTSLQNLLQEADFADVRIIESGRRNGKSFEFEIEARKPA